MITLSVVPMMKAASVKELKYNEDIPTGAKSLADYLMSATVKSVDETLTYEDYHDGTFQVFLDNKRRLVKKPGYEILMTDIDHVRFFTKGDFLYMNVARESQEYTYLIGDCYTKLEESKPDEKESEPDEEKKVPENPAKS
ncbi:MAG: competence type IV pilus minor pilin ComGF [Intestinibaculum porci]|jgi:hypothetical protein|uniref:competence type IV pilus minor pilin ComGF n=2 Tax=Intestinibaculum porci TaxID=2487118 RepID=UPI00240A4E80|nr:competence type IV pilus minor pilin ComGF [Intestinibaculum porci]MDD6422025.1 competence type IV pilus minor pilin ComGF [Intestinibaculum porci]